MIFWCSLFRVLMVNLVSRESLETLDLREMLVLLDPLDLSEPLVLRLGHLKLTQTICFSAKKNPKNQKYNDDEYGTYSCF